MCSLPWGKLNKIHEKFIHVEIVFFLQKFSLPVRIPICLNAEKFKHSENKQLMFFFKKNYIKIIDRIFMYNKNEEIV